MEIEKALPSRYSDFKLIAEHSRHVVWEPNDKVVYVCHDHRDRCQYAVKSLPGAFYGSVSSVGDTCRFMTDVCHLVHPNVVRTVRFECDTWGNAYQVMEFLDGARPVRSWLFGNSGDFKPGLDEGKLTVLREVADALDYVHACGLVHRDVKPSNVLVTRDGHAKLIDIEEFVWGTPHYIAPEAFPEDGRWCVHPYRSSDLWALAVMAYELIGGAVPFATGMPTYGFAGDIDRTLTFEETCVDGDKVGFLKVLGATVKRAEMPPIPCLSDAENAVLRKALSKDPKNRYGFCTAFVEALAAAHEAAKRNVPEVGPMKPKHRGFLAALFSWKVIVPVLFLAALGGGGYYGWTVYQKRQQEREAEQREKVEREARLQEKLKAEESWSEAIAVQKSMTVTDLFERVKGLADVSIEELDSAMPLLKSAKQQMSLAESDFTNQNYAAAAQRFDKAKDLFVQYEAEVKRCVEISKMREKKERKEAERQQKEANEARKRAEEAKAAVYASDWSFAIYQLSSADLEFKKGNFRAANNLFLAAKMTFDKGVKEVKAFPCLHLIAKVGGKEVAGAKLYDGECDHVTPIDWKLDHGKEYGPYVVSYDNDGKPYRGDFPATTADWYGPKTVAIELKDVTELFLAAIHEDNYTEASKMVDALETTTNADAQFWIGWMYDKGKGVETNYVKAAVWYRKAAEQGEGRAQNNLGYAYMEGLGVETNYVKAVEWYRKAAEQGNAVAQYNLGYMYENGNGVKEDLKEALKWYGKSADQGDPDAKKAMKRILMSEAANPEPKPMMSDSDEAIIEEEKLTVGKLRDANRLGRESCEQNVDVDLGFWIDPKVPSNKYFRVRVASKASNPLPIVSKDVVFLLDVSGSIGNDRLRNCRNAVMDALGRLNTGDRFNLVAFRDKCSYAFPDTAWREVDVNSIEEASKWLQTLRTHGQTDVFRALRSVLALPRTPARPMVAFVATDADATSGMTRSANIISRFSELNDGLVSIFMYGVKPEANAYLMDMLTRGNRGGWACHKGLRWEVGKSVPDLAKKFEKPVLTDIDVIFSPSSRAETYPGLVPNLCEDESIEIYGVCPADQKELVFQMRGLNAVTACESTFSLPFSSAKPLDARLRVEWAMRRLYEMIAEYTRKSDKNLLTNIHSFAAAYGLQDPYKEGMEKESAMSGTRVPDNTTGARPNSVKAIR